MREIDDSRPVHEANPTCVAIRHGPYTFSQTQYSVYGPLCGDGTVVVPGCEGQGDGGANPFEWDEFGATGLAPLDTLQRIVPAAELATGWQATASPSWVFHRLVQWGNVAGYRVLFGGSAGAAAATLAQEVQHSQWLQAEGLRYSWQAHRRAKPHRSAANSWTFNEPWPNAAHGSILTFGGFAKMAYYWTRSALAIVDISLHYGGLKVSAEMPLRASGISVWIENELDQPLTECDITLHYMDTSAANTSSLLATESHRVAKAVHAGAGVQVVTNELCTFKAPLRMVHTAVLLVRACLKCSQMPVPAQQTYTFAVVSKVHPQQRASAYRTFPHLIPTDRTNITYSFEDHKICESTCDHDTACVGYTTDATPTNCWLYSFVPALFGSPPDAFHLKSGKPVPPTVIPPPPPPPPPALLQPLDNVSVTTLALGRVQVVNQQRNNRAKQLSMTVKNVGEYIALFVRSALHGSNVADGQEIHGDELAYALFDKNYECLLPGESMNITATMFVAAASGERIWLCMEAWNTVSSCTQLEDMSSQLVPDVVDV